MKKFLVGLSIFILLIILLGFFLPTEYQVSRQISINSSPDKIHVYVGNLDNWHHWSPWKKADPSIQITQGKLNKGIGANQSWQGDSGKGNLTFTSSSPTSGISYDLYFDDDPNKNLSRVSYHTSENTTEVQWDISGEINLPILGGYIALLMDNMIGQYFESGLESLKKVVESSTSD